MSRIARIACVAALMVLTGAGIGWMFVTGVDPSPGPERAELWTERRAELDGFVADLRSYGRIRSMSDGRDHWKELNGERYESRAPLRSRAPRFEAVMRRDGIDPGVYHAFRKRLVRLRMQSVESTDRYTAFIQGGMLDNLHGYVWIAPGQAPPRPGERMLDDTEVVAVQRLDARWYFVATT